MIDSGVDFSQTDTSFYSIRHTGISRDIDRDELKKLIDKHVGLDYFSVTIHGKIVYIYIDKSSKEIVVSGKEIISLKGLPKKNMDETKGSVEQIL